MRTSELEAGNDLSFAIRHATTGDVGDDVISVSLILYENAAVQ